MIRYALACGVCDHEFESWFRDSAAYDTLHAAGQLACPSCGASDIGKQIMAPSVARRADSTPDPRKALATLAEKARAHVASTHDYVGKDFADEARAMYYGEKDARPIWGETTAEDAEALTDEGVPAAPLPKPFVPKVPKDEDELN